MKGFKCLFGGALGGPPPCLAWYHLQPHFLQSHMNHVKDIRSFFQHITFYTIKKFDFLNKGEACAWPLNTRLRKNWEFLRKVRPHPENTNSKNIKFCFIGVRHVPHFHTQGLGCLAFIHKENLRILKKGEACASPPYTRLRKNWEFSRRVGFIFNITYIFIEFLF